MQKTPRQIVTSEVALARECNRWLVEAKRKGWLVRAEVLRGLRIEHMFAARHWSTKA